MTYLTRFLLNAIVLPLTLILLVAGTWKANTRERPLCSRSSAKGTNGAKKDDAKTPANDGYDELQASKYSDYYFAVFLCCKSWSRPIESDCCYLQLVHPRHWAVRLMHTCVIRFAACTDPTMTQVQTSNVKLQVWSVCAVLHACRCVIACRHSSNISRVDSFLQIEQYWNQITASSAIQARRRPCGGCLLQSQQSVSWLCHLVYRWACLPSCTAICIRHSVPSNKTNCRWRQYTATTVESMNLWQASFGRKHVSNFIPAVSA